MKTSISFLVVSMMGLFSNFAVAESRQDTAKLLIKCDGTNKLMIVKEKLRQPIRTDRFVMTVQGDGGVEHQFVFQPIYGYVTAPGNPYPAALFHRNDYLNGVNMKFLEMEYSAVDMLGASISTPSQVFVDLNIDLARLVGQGVIHLKNVRGEILATIPVVQCQAEL